jgi:alanyl-tRNA synthetase
LQNHSTTSAGEKLAAEVKAAAALSGPELESTAAALRQTVDAAVVSTPLKAKLRGEVEALQRKAAAASKAAAAKAADTGVNAARAAAQTAAAAGAAALVTEVRIGSDAKAVKRVLDAVAAVAPQLAFFGISAEHSSDSSAERSGKLLCFAVCSEGAQASGLAADQWVAAAVSVCGGRGGGKPGAAQGQAPDAANMQQVIDAANAYLQDKGL